MQKQFDFTSHSMFRKSKLSWVKKNATLLLSSAIGIGFLIILFNLNWEISSVNEKPASLFREMIGIVSYCLGVFTGIKTSLLFKEHSSPPQNVNLSKAMKLYLLSGFLLGLPTMLETVSIKAIPFTGVSLLLEFASFSFCTLFFLKGCQKLEEHFSN